jgi:hypothetical protein
MANFSININLNDDNRYFKGDTLSIEVNVNQSIENWEIRAELYDLSGNSSRIATANVTGGSDDQISIDDESNGVFTLVFEAGETTDFDDNVILEIQRTTATGDVKTYQAQFSLNNEEIDWDDVDE